jgi:chromosome segregation ATPase
MQTSNNNQPPSRLDQIEAILLQVVTQQQATATALTQVTQRLDRVAEQQETIETNLDRVTQRLDRVAEQQEVTASRFDSLATGFNEIIYKIDDFIGTANTVLGRSAILDDVVVELRETVTRLDANAERMQANFEENQRSTNAALERLETILVRLIGGQNGHT